jgi:hypothetical protein
MPVAPSAWSVMVWPGFVRYGHGRGHGERRSSSGATGSCGDAGRFRARRKKFLPPVNLHQRPDVDLWEAAVRRGRSGRPGRRRPPQPVPVLSGPGSVPRIARESGGVSLHWNASIEPSLADQAASLSVRVALAFSDVGSLATRISSVCRGRFPAAKPRQPGGGKRPVFTPTALGQRARGTPHDHRPARRPPHGPARTAADFPREV